MKVYVVTEDQDHEDEPIHGVFSTLDKAVEYCHSQGYTVDNGESSHGREWSYLPPEKSGGIWLGLRIREFEIDKSV